MYFPGSRRLVNTLQYREPTYETKVVTQYANAGAISYFLSSYTQMCSYISLMYRFIIALRVIVVFVIFVVSLCCLCGMDGALRIRVDDVLQPCHEGRRCTFHCATCSNIMSSDLPAWNVCVVVQEAVEVCEELY